MSFTFHRQKQKEGTLKERGGVLRIEVPHWAAEVLVFNSMLQPITQVGKITREEGSKNDFMMDMILEPGVYQVQMSLEGKTESEWIPVNEGKITHVSPKVWNKLKFTSASPLEDIDNYNKTHTKKAVELSQEITWQYKDGGSSRLFLFVRTLDPKASGEAFSDGLELLNEKGEVITDFSEGIKKDKRQGWMAFNAELPGGGYILRRGRSGVRLRYQVFYLCEGWTTQVFLKARRYPALSNWSLNTVRRGTGFHPANETVLAAAVITENLRHSSNSLFLLQNEKIQESINILLDEKTGNPCLGILAAHAIIRSRGQIEKLQAQVVNLHSRKSTGDDTLPKQLEEQILQAQKYCDILELKLKPFLQRNIGDHPDVRALLLKNDSPADKPFYFPPSLLAGFQMVQAHSLRFTDTIPLNSLIDCASDSLVINSPWTAWRHLARQPTLNLSPQAKRLQFKKSAESDFQVSSVLSQTAAPRTPVYRLAESAEQPAQQSAAEMILQDAPMIQKAKEVVIDYAKTFAMEDLPPVINLNSSEEINKVLAQVTPEEVSLNFGISLSRTEECLKTLHSKAASILQEDDPTEPPKKEESLSTVQQAILEYALFKFGRSQSETTEPARAVAKYTIREIVNKIQSEADRLCVAASGGKSLEAVPSPAEKLYEIAQSLLKHADFVLITNAQGKILYSNGTFLSLISPKLMERVKMAEKEIIETHSAKRKQWEDVLASAQTGLSDIQNSYESGDWQNWKLSRTEINDEAANRSACYLNLLRLVGFPPLDEETLREIDSSAGNLTFYVPLLIYGSGDNKEEYEKKLDEIILQLQKWVK